MTAPQSDNDPQFKVTMINGQTMSVLTQAEADYYETSKLAYLEQTKFTEETDFRDLDRLLGFELLIFRWTQWLTAGGFKYDGDFVDDEKQLNSDLKYYSDQINKIKEQMGLTKKARDAATAEGNFALWLADLKARAKAFGIHREKQLTKALVLMNELSAVVGTFDRSDEEERQKIGFESEKDIVDWVRKTMLPEFREIDEHFRANEQRYWIRNQ